MTRDRERIIVTGGRLWGHAQAGATPERRRLADEERDFVSTWGLHVKVYEADWRVGRKAGPIRNGQMVQDGAIRCLAFPGGNGTADCIRQARAAEIPVTDFST